MTTCKGILTGLRVAYEDELPTVIFLRGSGVHFSGTIASVDENLGTVIIRGEGQVFHVDLTEIAAVGTTVT